MSTLKYWLWLTTRPGLQPGGSFRLLEHFGTPERAYFADPEEYALVEGLSSRARESLDDKSLDEADRILSDCERLGLRILTLGDGDYPDRLRQIDAPPTVLYIRGRVFPFDDEIAIGVVGSRQPSEYGKRMAGKLGLELARHGALVVSGIAQGLDSAAIRGALKGGGPAVSVLGCGIDVVYPRENRFLYEDVAAVGALISEYPPGTGVRGEHFPARNRILSGLCLGVAAVECRLQSGTMSTVRWALDQGRDVFAVPGNADAVMSEGPNRLIQEGAGLVTGGWEIVREYADRFPGRVKRPEALSPQAQEARLEAPPEPAAPEKAENPVDRSPKRDYIDLNDPALGLTDDQKDLLTALGERKLLADELVEQTQIPARRVLSALTMLQVQGMVAEHPGKRFESLVRTR